MERERQFATENGSKKKKLLCFLFFHAIHKGAKLAFFKTLRTAFNPARSYSPQAFAMPSFANY